MSLSSRSISTWHSGSPKRALNSTSFGPVGGDHHLAEEHAAVGRALGGDAGEGRLDQPRARLPRPRRRSAPAPAHRSPCRRCWGPGRRRRRACGPGRRRTAGWSRRRRGRTARRSRRPGTPRSPPARPAAPKRPPSASSIAASAVGAVWRDDHALAGGQAVGLDHDRAAANRSRNALAGAGVVEHAVARGRQAVAVGEGLGEGLGGLQPARRRGRAEAGDAGLGQGVGQARLDRRLPGRSPPGRRRSPGPGRPGRRRRSP